MTVDTQKLRELLEKATPGPWVAKDSRGAGLEIYADVGTQMRGEKRDWPFFSTGNADIKQNLIAYEQWVQFPTEKLNNIQAWNAAYIAAVNPSTVSALLAENDALREFASAYVLWVVTGAKPERIDELFGMAKAALNPPAPPQGDGA